MIVVVYVNDLALTRNNPDLIFRLKIQLANTFEVTNLNIFHFLLGLQVLPLLDGVFISQSKHVLDLLKRFKMDDCKACSTLFQSDVKLAKDCESP